MTENNQLQLRLCDDVRQGPKGPLIGRVMYNSDPKHHFFIAIPFSEALPAAFSTRWDALDYVENRGKPIATAQSAEPADVA